MIKRRVKAAALGTAMLLAGIGGFATLASLKHAPSEASAATGPGKIAVQTVRLEPIDAQVTVRGYGEVRSLRRVEVAPEVSGSVVRTHPHFVAGRVIAKDEVLFALDPRPYEAALQQTEARVALWRTTLKRLETEAAAERARLTTLQRSAELAKARYDRAHTLHERSIGNQTDVESAERAYNDAKDAVAQLQQRLAAYPLQLEEARKQLDAEEAQRKQAALRLEYTQVKAPFNCRITDVFVERGQYVAQGQRAARIADDSALEIPVKLDAREARAWLQFDETSMHEDMAWFARLKPVPCQIRWVEHPGDAAWKGRLDRVERFDPATRTVTAIVRVSAEDARNCPGEPLPLVAGMFCDVAIPGRKLSNVFAVPRSAISVDGRVYLARDSRLRSAPVEVLRIEDDTALVRNGLEAGDALITTRLVNPLENTLLALTETGSTPSKD